MIKRCYFDANPITNDLESHCISVDVPPKHVVSYHSYIDFDLPSEFSPQGEEASRIKLACDSYVQGKEEARVSPAPQPLLVPTTLDELYARVEHFAHQDVGGETEEDRTTKIAAVVLYHMEYQADRKILNDVIRRHLLTHDRPMEIPPTFN